MTKNDLLGLDVKVEDDFWIAAKFVEEKRRKEIVHQDGSVSGAHTYLMFSDDGTGWYRFYKQNKTRKTKGEQETE